MTQSAIPQEIIDLIISLLRSDDTDNDTLYPSLNCALASRCCLAMARLNVFHSITIPWEDVSSTTQVFEMLEHPLCSIPAMNVNSVTFKLAPSPQCDVVSRVHPGLGKILDLFPFATVLGGYFSFPPIDPLGDVISTTFFRQITELSFVGHTSSDVMNKIVASCPPLQRLSVSEYQRCGHSPVWPFNTSAPTEATLIWPHSLQVLEMPDSHHYFQKKFHWLTAQGCTSIHSLDLTKVSLNASDVMSYLSLLGPNLRHVRCSNPERQPHGLSNNNNIEIMELDCLFVIDLNHEDGIFRRGSDVRLEHALSSFPTAKLRKLAVRYTLSHLPGTVLAGANNGWEWLDQRLAERQFMPRLEELHFVGENQPSSHIHLVLDLDLQTRVKKLFGETFPRCNARGMMTFSFQSITVCKNPVSWP